METTKNKPNSKTKTILVIIGILSVVVLLSCIALNFNPSLIAGSIIDFATHHYFLMGFISLTMVSICWKLYLSLDDRSHKKTSRFIGKKRALRFAKVN